MKTLIIVFLMLLNVFIVGVAIGGDHAEEQVSTTQPITPASDVPPAVKSIVFVVDSGGSMITSRATILDQVKAITSHLNASQRFNLVLAKDQPTAFSKDALVEANKENLDKLTNFMDGTTAQGTSDVLAAFKTAVSQHPQLVIGFVNERHEDDDREAFNAMEASAKRVGTTVHTFVIYTAPDGVERLRNRGATPGQPDIKDQISALQAKLDSLPADSPQRGDFANRLLALRKKASDEAASQRQADAEKLAQQATQQRAVERAAAQQQAKEAAAQHVADLAALRTTKFPDWQGPWKTCPICGGTGRDADAEREINTRTALSSGIAGTGTEGRFNQAVVHCPVCGGSGQIPDVR